MTTTDPPIDAHDLRDMVDEQAIRRLHAHYVDAVNRSAWGEFVDLFVPDAALTVSRGAGQADRVVGPVAVGELIPSAADIDDPVTDAESHDDH